MEEINMLSFDDKIKVWLDYVATQYFLNNDRNLLSVGENKYDFINTIHFPVLGVYWGQYQKSPIMNFDDFTNLEKCSKKTDYGTQYGGAGIQTNYSGIYDWFPKFKDRIFKKDKNDK